MADTNDKTASADGNAPQARASTNQPAGAERMAERALESANRAAKSIASETGASAAPVDLPSFSNGTGSRGEPGALAMLDDVLLHVKVELGRTRMYVEDVLRLSADSVVELDKAAGDPVDIYVNERHVARGEVLVVNENFCVRVSEILAPVAPE
jgi:flagellar motor switch protein FliN/FliY